MNITNIQKRHRKPQDKNSEESSINLKFDYDSNTYILDFQYFDNIISTVEFGACYDNLELTIYRNDKCLRFFQVNDSKKDNLIFDIIQKKDKICIEIYDPKTGVQNSFFIENKIAHYTTSLSEEALAINQENLEIHQIMFDEILDKNLILNSIKPFLISMDINKYKNMFDNLFKLTPDNLLEHEKIIKETQENIQEFKQIVCNSNNKNNLLLKGINN